MIRFRALAILSAVALVTAPAVAQDAPPAATQPPAPLVAMTAASLVITLESSGDIERNTVSYQCDDEQTLGVQYINAAPNFLAIVPVDGQALVMTTVISASGARYVAGPYEWWSHQGEATLRDVTAGEDAEALATCTESSNTP